MLALWAVLLTILFITGKSYRDYAVAALKSQLDERLKTEVILKKDDIRVSFLRNFPNVSIRLGEVLVRSSPELVRADFDFDGADTLVFAQQLSLIFDLRSVISKSYELKSIELDKAVIYVLSDKRGNKNYEILQQTDRATDSLDLTLQEIEIKNSKIRYTDLDNDVDVLVHTRRTRLNGNFLGQHFNLMADFRFESTDITVNSDEITRVIPADGKIRIGKQAGIISFSEGELRTMGLFARITGDYSLASGAYGFHIDIPETAVKKIRLPEFLEVLEKNALDSPEGDISIEVGIKRRSENEKTRLHASFALRKGAIRIRDDHRISGIYTQGYYQTKAYTNNQTDQLILDTLILTSGNSQLAGSLSLESLKNPWIKGQIRGSVDLGDLMKFEQVSSRFQLEGSLKGNINLAGRLPRKENQGNSLFSQLSLNGEMTVANALVDPLNQPIPGAVINGTLRMRNKDEVILEDVSMQTGKSDLLINGKIRHLPVLTGDRSKFPTYQCSVKSRHLHVEDLMKTGDSQQESDRQVELPDSLRIIATVDIGQFRFGKFTASNVTGSVMYFPYELQVRNFSMNTQGGSLVSDIDLRQEDDRIKAGIKAQFSEVDIRDMFLAFNNFRQSVISAEHIDGTLTGTASVHAVWDSYLNPELDQLKVESDISIQNGELKDYPPMMGLARFIHVEELEHIRFENLRTQVSIANSMVSIPQTHIGSSAISLDGSGVHDFDNRYEYHMQVMLSDILWKKAQKKKPESTEFGYVVDDGLGRTSLPLVVRGTGSNFEVEFDKAVARSGLRERVREERETWRELLGGRNNTREEQTEVRLEWEEDSTFREEQETPDPDETEPDETDEQEVPFRIEWDDE